MNCPSCGTSVPAGETICMDCGTELVFAMSDAPLVSAPEPAPEVAAAPAKAKAKEIPCPDCGEVVSPDANGLCMICGHDFGGIVEFNEEEFFQDPPSLEEAMEVERRRLAGDAPIGIAAPPLSGESSRPASEDEPLEKGPPPLPGDRKRQRWKGTGASPAVGAVEEAWLMVGGSQTVFFDGKMTSQLKLNVDQVLIGRRDPSQGHYPDVDLGHFRQIDAHISRRHARVYRKGGRWFLEDLCENDATYLNDKAHVLNGQTVPLKNGDKVLISDSVAMTFRLQD
ncbi:MAG: hypothetical protein ACJAYU_001473 [Bradymonadia bacterium]|jgi:hypothetical protein